MSDLDKMIKELRANPENVNKSEELNELRGKLVEKSVYDNTNELFDLVVPDRKELSNTEKKMFEAVKKINDVESTLKGSTEPDGTDYVRRYFKLNSKEVKEIQKQGIKISRILNFFSIFGWYELRFKNGRPVLHPVSLKLSGLNYNGVDEFLEVLEDLYN